MSSDDFLASLLVVGKCSLTRKGILAEITLYRFYDICGETGKIPYARQLCEKLRPDLIVLDLDRFENGELTLIRDFRRLHPGVIILVISYCDDPMRVHRVFRAGARGYVAKEDCSKDLLTGLRHLHLGEKTFLSNGVKMRLFQEVGRGTPFETASGIDALPDRAMEVFRLIGEGKRPSEISATLKITVKTVETHQKRIKEKLGLRTMKDLRGRAAEWLFAQNGNPKIGIEPRHVRNS